MFFTRMDPLVLPRRLIKVFDISALLTAIASF
jgi:hypothetical protein